MLVAEKNGFESILSLRYNNTVELFSIRISLTKQNLCTSTQNSYHDSQTTFFREE